jgi:hypothetical protein
LTRVNSACKGGVTEDGTSSGDGLELCCRSDEVLAPILPGVLWELAVNGPPQSGAWGLDESSFSCKQRGCSADGASSPVVATKAGESTRVNGACTEATAEGASGGDGSKLDDRSNAASSSRRQGGSADGASSRVVAASGVPSKQSALCSGDEDR